MTDDPTALTPEQTRILAEFADNMKAARKAVVAIAWLAGGATAVAALAYYVLGAITGWHSMETHR